VASTRKSSRSPRNFLPPDSTARLRVWTDNPNRAIDVFSQLGDGIFSRTALSDGEAIRGQADGAAGTGVVGLHAQSSNVGRLGGELRGVQGLSTQINGAGVFGQATTDPGFGGFFLHEGPGVGVGGYAISQTGESIGVYGTSWSDDGYAMYAIVLPGADGTALFAQSGSENGLAGRFVGNVSITGHTTVGPAEEMQVTGAEYFGVHTGADDNDFGGMYVSGAGDYSLPFYGYSAGGDVDAFHYFIEQHEQWRLWCGDDRIFVNRSGGNVGIATESPQFRLHVNGTAGKPGGGSWSVASDARLKKDIERLDGALEAMLELKGVTFEYVDAAAIGELGGERMGLVAQDVEVVFPDWIEEGEDGFKRMTVRGFEAVVVEAMRELRAEKDAQIEGLRLSHADRLDTIERENSRRLKALEQENDALRTRLEALEAAMLDLAAERGARQ